MTSGGRGSDNGNRGIIVRGDFSAGQVAAGDGARAQMNVGSGANLRIGSRRGSTGPEDPRAALQSLLRELEAALRSAPPRRAVEADLIAAQATQLVKAATSRDADRPILQHIGKGLKETADFLRETVPAAITIVGQLVSLVSRLHGVSI
jgi:hypothetical protein